MKTGREKKLKKCVYRLNSRVSLSILQIRIIDHVRYLINVVLLRADVENKTENGRQFPTPLKIVYATAANRRIFRFFFAFYRVTKIFLYFIPVYLRIRVYLFLSVLLSGGSGFIGSGRAAQQTDAAKQHAPGCRW